MNALRFHHTGVACVSIDDDLERFRALGYEPEAARFVDEAQGIQGLFLVGPGTRVELLEQLPGSTVLEPWLRSNTRLYHQAFEADELEPAISTLVGRGGVVVRQPTPAAAFLGRRIAFVMLPGMLLIEVIEALPGSGPERL